MTSQPGLRTSGGKRPDKGSDIAAKIRARILNGQYAPLSKLPTWTELEKRYRAARPTITRAIAKLREDGFIYSDSTRGTYVVERPPHLNRYAVVFTFGPQIAGWNRFWATMAHVAVAMHESGERQMAVFYNVDERPGSEAFARLSYDISSQRIAGVVFVDVYAAGKGLRVAYAPQFDAIPAASIGSADPDGRIPVIRMEFETFIDRSLEHARAKRRKRIAVISNGEAVFNLYPAKARERGLAMKPHWLQSVDVHSTWMAKNVVRLLLDRPEGERPDMLVIADDNLVESSLAGIVESRVRVPEELDVIVHCNWPLPAPTVLPVTRLGFDVREILTSCIGSIDAQRRGTRAARRVDLAARFEHEITPSADSPDGPSGATSA